MYTISEFRGIDQSKSENGLNPAYSPDACNMDTENGDLAVAKGFVKHIPIQFSDPGDHGMASIKIYAWKTKSGTVYVMGFDAMHGASVLTKFHGIACHVNTNSSDWLGGTSWNFTDENAYADWHFREVTIGEIDYLLIASGDGPIVKMVYGGLTGSFGSGEYIYQSTVTAYADRVVTLDGAINQNTENRLMQAGIYINDVYHAVESVNKTAKTVTLKEAPSNAPTAGQTVKVTGGLSDAPVRFIEMHYGRLFAAGDKRYPVRLYWSQVPGDYRSIEDWTADDASENTGGGYVEVGSSSDPIVGLCALSNQLLIFKRDSLYRLLGDRPSNYRIVQVNAEIEETTNDSIILYGDTPIWMTKAGLYFFDGQTARPMGNARQIKTFLEGVSLKRCKGCENRDKLYFTAREGDDSRGDADNVLVVYDVVNKTYMIRRGFDVSDLYSRAGTLYMMNPNGYFYRMEEGDTYDGDPIEAYWKTPLSDLNGKYEEKNLVRMYLRGISENDAALLVESRTGRHTITSRILLSEDEHEVAEIPLRGQGRTVTFRFSNEAGGRWTIKGGVQTEFSVTGRP